MSTVYTRKKKLRDLLGLFKDKASLIKIKLSKKSTSSSIHVAILSCTTHTSTSPFWDYRLTPILSVCKESRATAYTCITATMNRLHGTTNAYVALKCLITLHNIITRGSFILKDQVSGARDFFNLSTFLDKSDVDTWELSSWVRWYGRVLERNLMASRVLGCYFSFIWNKSGFDKEKKSLNSLLNPDLLREIETLVGMVEEICCAPDSLHFQKNNLVYEAVKLVSEDYRLCQYHIMVRLSEFCERIECLNFYELSDICCGLERLENRREMLSLLFANRKRNVVFWELVSETKTKILKEMKDREEMMVTANNVFLTLFGDRIVVMT